MADNTLNALQKLKVDCFYKKNTHFNAARRLHRSAFRFRNVLVIGTIVASFSLIMNVGLWDKIPSDTTNIQTIVNVLGALGGFLILYATTFADHHSKINSANQHELIGSDLDLIYKKIRNTEALYSDNVLDDKELSTRLDELTNEYTSKCSAAPLTRDEDYELARENYKKGYSEYTKEELDL